MFVAVSAAAGAVVALFVLYGTLVQAVPAAIASALVYLAPVLAAETLTDRPLTRWVEAQKPPLDWAVFLAVKFTLALGIAGAGSALMLLLGLARSWQDLYLANRMVVVVSIAAAIVIRVFRTTRQQLENRTRALEEQVAAESREAERAREIQQALMPRQLPALRGCELAGGCQPARSVGGDYYDAIPLGDSRVALIIADVCGKGMSAALLMSNLQAIVRAFAAPDVAPEQLCAKANRLIAGNVAPGKYITFFCAVLDCRSMRLEYSNAGHNPPLLLRAGGAVERLTEGGPVLGIFPQAVYESGACALGRGDRLVLFTDGITEAMSPGEEEFGEERLLALLDAGGECAGEALRRVQSAVTTFSHGTLHDDATLLVARLA